MPAAQQKIIINTTPDKIFAVITDYENIPFWKKSPLPR